MGAWIEIFGSKMFKLGKDVAPLVGAWIEIHLGLYLFVKATASLPSWERGLKYKYEAQDQGENPVAPLVGAWIEIYYSGLSCRH